MARSENHGCVRMADSKILKRFEQRSFFIFDGAAANEDWSGPLGRERTAKAFDDWRSRRNVDIELQISCDPYACRIRTNGLQPGAVLFRLREEEIDLCKHASEGPAEAVVTRFGTIGNACIDDRDAGAALMRQAQEVRPEFSLGEYDQFRLQRLQIRTDRCCEVHGEVKDVLIAKALSRLILPSIGGRRDQNSMLRKGPAQLRDQANDGQDFSERNRVNPDDSDAIE